MENKNYNIEEEDNGFMSYIDMKKLLSDVVKYWWLFVISVAIVLVGLKYYHRYKTKMFHAKATVIIDNSVKSPYRVNILDGVNLGQNMSNFDNQLAILGSRTLVTKVIEQMGIYVSYYHIGRIKDTDMYGTNEFTVVMDSTHVQPIGTRIYVTPVDDNSFKISVSSEGISTYNYSADLNGGSGENKIAVNFEDTFHYGEPVITPWCAFSIVANSPITEKYYFYFNSPESLIAQYSSQLKISSETKTESTVVTLGITGSNKQKCIVFLNTLVNTYVNDNLRQKTQMSENTIRFIENQLGLLSDSLDVVSTQLSRFRSNNRIQDDLSKKGEDLFNEIKSYETELKQLTLENGYYDYLEDYFNNDSIMKGDIAPATFKTERPIITDQLNRILDINAKRQVYRDTYGREGNPMFDALNAEFNIVRNTLLTSIKSQREMVAKNMNEVKSKIATYTQDIMDLPEAERALLGIDRKFKVTNELYTFLMQKRAEAQIQRASSTPDHKALDRAVITGQVSPNINQNKMVGLMAAICLPLGFLVIRQLLDNKIRTSSDVKKLTQMSIIGEIPNNKKETTFVVQEYPRSMVAEEFRRMRIKLNFMTKGCKPTIIAVTSSMPEDGKTFCSINTASVFAIAKQKTLLLGFDLRKPGLSKIINIENKEGITDYLIGNCKLEDIIVKVGDLYVIGSGTVPPNPSELIVSAECRQMMDRLKEEFDVIVMDTPPVGLVSDAILLSQMADTTMFVIRQDYTNKNALKFTLEQLSENNLKNPAVVLNDINNKKTRYGYGYGYGNYGKYGQYGQYGKKHGYGYGYTENDD